MNWRKHGYICHKRKTEIRGLTFGKWQDLGLTLEIKKGPEIYSGEESQSETNSGKFFGSDLGERERDSAKVRAGNCLRIYKFKVLETKSDRRKLVGTVPGKVPGQGG